MTKDSVKLAGALSVLVDAKNHIDKWGSTAEDSGTELRTARHFLQRAINSYQAEVHDTMAAALLLNIPSFYCSERFSYTPGWQVVRLAYDLLGETPTWLAQRPDDEVGDDLHGDEDDEDGETVEIGKDSAWTREQKEESLDGMGGTGNLKVYYDHEGTGHALSDAVHYRFRGFELDRMSQNEYKGCVTMVEMSADEKEQAQAALAGGEALTFEQKKRRGRQPNGSVTALARDSNVPCPRKSFPLQDPDVPAPRPCALTRAQP